MRAINDAYDITYFYFEVLKWIDIKDRKLVKDAEARLIFFFLLYSLFLAFEDNEPHSIREANWP